MPAEENSDSAAPPQLTLTLHPDAVARPVHQAVKTVTDVIGFCLDAVEKGDVSAAPPQPSGGMTFEIGRLAITDEERRVWYRNWLISRGLHELARGVRKMLEQAYSFVEIFNMPPRRTTMGEFQEQAKALGVRANKINFPDLLAAVNRRLDGPLDFEREFLSLQAVRNCMEHRAGLVGHEDVTNGSDALTLALPRFKVFGIVNGEEIEVFPGIVFEEATTINVRRVIRERTYKIGEKIQFDHESLNEAAFACHLFSVDLISKLPKRATAAA